MSYKIIFLNPAADELDSAFTWCEENKSGLGSEFLEEVEDYLKLIQNNPLLFEEQKNRSNLHKVPLVRFPLLNNLLDCGT